MKILFFIFFTILMIRILVTGDLVKYVHPRFAPFIAASCIVSFLMIVSMFRKMRSAGHVRFSVMRIAALSLPLILGFAVRPVTGSYVDDFSAGGSSQKGFFAGTSSSDNLSEPIVNARNAEIIDVDSAHYFILIQDLYDNPSSYKGRKIHIMGKTITRKNNPDKTEFAVIRMMMTCCTADLQPIGLICKYPRVSELNRSSWYKLAGTIDYIEQKNESIPVIRVDSAEATQKPANEYVYPF